MVQAVPSHTVDPWQLEEKQGGLPLQVLRSLSSLQFLDSLSRGFETTWSAFRLSGGLFWDSWSILVFSRTQNMKALLFQPLDSTLIPCSVLRETTKQSRATSIDWWGPHLLISNMSMGIFGSSPSPPVFFMSAEGQNLMFHHGNTHFSVFSDHGQNNVSSWWP